MDSFNKDVFDKENKNRVKDINIEVPEALKISVLETLDKLPKRKIKKKRNYKRVAGIATFILVGSLVFNAFMPAYAESLPIIGPTFKSINEVIGIGDKYVKGAKDVNIVEKYKDVTMTIKNVYYDGVDLAIAYEIQSPDGFEKNPIIFPIIKKGFKRIDYDNEENKGEFRDDNTYVGLASYVFPENELSDETKISFIVNNIYGDWDGYYPQKFKFNLKLDAEDMGKSIYKIDKEINYNDSKFKIAELVKSPLNTIVHFDSDTAIEKYGEDSAVEKDELIIMAIDDKGMPVNFKSGVGAGNGFNVNDARSKGSGYWRFEGLSEDAKSITLIPIIRTDFRKNQDKANYVMNRINNNGETIIKLKTGEEYIIKSIEFKEDKTLVNINVKKYLDGIDYVGISIWDDERIQKYLDSSNGKEENWYEGTMEIEIEETKFNGIEDGYNFTLTLPKLDSSKDYYVPIWDDERIILENEKITIDLR